MVYKREINRENILYAIDKMEKYGIFKLPKLKENSNILFLRYEDFYQNFEFVFNALENHFDIKISEKKKEVLRKKYSIDKVKKEIQSKKDFNDYDPVTQWHGDHVSIYKGTPGYYKHVFSKEQISFMESYFSEFIGVMY